MKKILLAAASFLTTHVHPGDRVGNVFSRTISYASDSFPEVAFRVSGTCVYTALDSVSFTCAYRYDGRAPGQSTVSFSDHGRLNSFNGAAPVVNTDGSGVMYNSLIWGEPPASLREGDTWTVTIAQPWELGGPGSQTVSVLSVDAFHHTVRLKREGSGDGFYDNDMHTVPVTVHGVAMRLAVTPGRTHWVGYTTFRDGLVVSDELMSTRTVALSSGDSLHFTATEREYILLNEMPS